MHSQFEANTNTPHSASAALGVPGVPIAQINLDELEG